MALDLEAKVADDVLTFSTKSTLSSRLVPRAVLQLVTVGGLHVRVLERINVAGVGVLAMVVESLLYKH